MPINVYNFETKTHTPTHVGLVVALFEENGYHDSDFFAMVWNPETKSLNRILYDTTRGAMYGGAYVDATPEVLAEVEAMQERNRAEHNARREELYSKCAEKGAVARVNGLKGKNLHLNGTEGIVFWKGHDKFGTKYSIRVGIEINGTKHFISGNNVFVNGSDKSAERIEIECSAFRRVAGVVATHTRGFYK
jgi:hypothetical protein